MYLMRPKLFGYILDVNVYVLVEWAALFFRRNRNHSPFSMRRSNSVQVQVKAMDHNHGSNVGVSPLKPLDGLFRLAKFGGFGIAPDKQDQGKMESFELNRRFYFR